MYTTPWCGYCHRLKSQLDREGIAFDMVDIEQDPDAAARRRAGQRRQPDRADAGLLRRHRADQPLAGRRSRRSSPRSPEDLTSRRLTHHWPGSGPPYQCSTSDRLIETPPGSTSVPASASARISLAGEPAGVLDLPSVDVDLAGWPRGR